MLNRRGVLAAGGIAAGVLGVPQLLAPAEGHEDSTHDVHPAAFQESKTFTGTKPEIVPWTRPMPVPPVLKPLVSTPRQEIYQLTIDKTTAEILPGLQSPVLGYGGQFVGPTIRAKTGRKTLIMFQNRLDEPANVHLHGGHVAPEHDGHPRDLIEPGRTRLYLYPNTQQGATLWYHDHSHGTEAAHTYLGLHGAYVVEDDSERGLNLPTGAYDVPILLRDIQFDDSGNIVVFDDPAKRTVVLANGVPQPYFEVAARKYRFRLVNSANQRVFHLRLAGTPFTRIGSDGGLLASTTEVEEMVLSSAERSDIVIDFAKYPIGTRIVLTDSVAGEILRFDVVRRASDSSRVPAVLRPLPAMPYSTVDREVDLFYVFKPNDRPDGVINGKVFDMDRVDFTIKRGATETWLIKSSDPAGVKHNFHMHLVQFRVLERNGGAPLPSDLGLKDTIPITAGETVKVQATFTGHTGRYVYHCHFLEHSWIGMMAQMEIVP
ncbi:bilirubin oxidase [Lentzea guizhouensis]|uniref:Multicopper oxidase CueO n=1 Tax=Lentzea guizhouensis TaxID=1586287 RepID=A0A1B2HMI7_9PSEU|nr:multicopper oxidase domain-containing protein [Lentzea guizhouensis]ANZ38933.1 bilirubin oxidase [Lentzea guizhouensis]